MDPTCVECQKQDDPVTPENGVWLPDANAKSVPLHRACAARWTLRQANDNKATLDLSGPPTWNISLSPNPGS